MPTLTIDEQKVKTERQLEQLLNTTVKQNDNMTRADACRLIAKMALKKATQRTMRAIVEPTAISTV
jgi:tRNA splicing ligase